MSPWLTINKTALLKCFRRYAHNICFDFKKVCRKPDKIYNAEHLVLRKIVDLIDCLFVVYGCHITAGDIPPVGHTVNMNASIGQNKRAAVKHPLEIELTPTRWIIRASGRGRAHNCVWHLVLFHKNSLCLKLASGLVEKSLIRRCREAVES